MNQFRWGLLCILLLLAAACAPLDSTLKSTVTVSPTFSTNVERLTPTFTRTPAPTRVSPTAAPTANVFETAAIVFSDFSTNIERISSPNWSCTWERLVADPRYDDFRQKKYENQFYIRIFVHCIYRDMETEWVLVDDWTEMALGYPFPSLLGWSADEKSLYFYDAIIPDGCAPIGGFQQNLRQVDLSSGTIQSIPIEWTGGMALSPDSEQLVYYDREMGVVLIYDLTEDKQQAFPLVVQGQPAEDWFAGDFTWSPDGKVILFLTVAGDSCFPTKTTLWHLDRENNEIHSLFESEQESIHIKEWTDPDWAVIMVDGVSRWIDPATGKFQTP